MTQKIRQTRIYRKKLFVYLLLSVLFSGKSFSQLHFNCLGASSQNVSFAASALPQVCDTSFTGTSAKYKYQSTWIPKTTDPVITVKLVVHVFTPSTPVPGAWNSGNGQYNGFAALKKCFENLCTDPAGGFFGQKLDRFSQVRMANYTVPGFSPTYIFDSKIQFEIVGYYFYTSNTLHYGTANGLPSAPQFLDSAHTIPNPAYNPTVYDKSNAMNYINLNFPERLGEGLPIIMMSNGQSQSGYNSSVAGVIPYLTVQHHPGIDPATEASNNAYSVAQLRHEIGHCFGLYHSYYGGKCYPVAPSPHPETLNCNAIDYLSDLFPINNPNAAANSAPLPTLCPNPPLNTACNNVFENGDTLLNNSVYTNNIMSDNIKYSGIAGGPGWMTPLQMGRRMRALHFKSDAYNWHNSSNWSNLRYYVKDMASEHTYPMVIDSNETWAFDIQMYKDIVVKQGRTLTIKCKVAMATDGKIIVEKGAKLVIDGGTVTGWCKQTPAGSYYKTPLWFGIEVRGNPGLNQLINNLTGLCPNQGIVEIKNNGTISHAQHGIFTGFSYNGQLLPAGNSGGIVIANNANFTNNVFDILFFSYRLGNVKSRLVNCAFKTTGEIGRDSSGALIEPKEHVKLYQNTGLHFENCTFANTFAGYANNPGTGIYSTDSQFNVGYNNATGAIPATKCRFNNLWVGVHIDNFNPLYAANIKNSTFTENQYSGIVAENANYLVVSEDTFNIRYAQKGAYIYQSKYYKIKNNTFLGKFTASPSLPSETPTGIGVYSSGDGAHEIYRNDFGKLQYGIIASDNNGGLLATAPPGLKMNCNRFRIPTLLATNNRWDIALTKQYVAPSVDPEQSVFQATNPKPTSLVRNIYGAIYINASTRNKFFVDNSSLQTINHATNSDNNTQPNVPNNQASPQVNISQTSYLFDYANHCPSYPSSSGGTGNPTQRLQGLNDYIDVLYAQNPPDFRFELQSTVSSRLNVFLTDTLEGSADSVISILQANQGAMADADIQLVFAYMKKGDYAMALQKKNDLGASRTAWKDFLGKLIALEQDTLLEDGMLGAADAAYFSGYAGTEAGPAQASAQAILKYSRGTGHNMPLAYPPDPGDPDDEGQVEERRLYNEGVSKTSLINNSLVNVYPNPAQTGINIEYSGREEVLTVQIKDLLGKVIFTTFIKERAYVSLNGLSNGVYLLTILDRGKEIVYQGKLVKQN